MAIGKATAATDSPAARSYAQPLAPVAAQHRQAREKSAQAFSVGVWFMFLEGTGDSDSQLVLMDIAATHQRDSKNCFDLGTEFFANVFKSSFLCPHNRFSTYQFSGNFTSSCSYPNLDRTAIWQPTLRRKESGRIYFCDEFRCVSVRWRPLTRETMRLHCPQERQAGRMAALSSLGRLRTGAFSPQSFSIVIASQPLIVQHPVDHRSRHLCLLPLELPVRFACRRFSCRY